MDNSIRHYGRAALLVMAGVLAVGAAPAVAAPVHDAQAALMARTLFPLMTAAGDASLGQQDSAMLAARRQRIDQCAHVPACVVKAAQWTDAERDALATGLATAFAQHPPAPGLIPDDGVRSQILREVKGLNSILQVYGQGAQPRFPKIDGPKDAAGSVDSTATLASAVMLGEAMEHDPVSALDPSTGLALALLDANNRGEAIAFEPLDIGINRVAVERARHLDWSRYRYAAIIVLGVGPEDTLTRLSPLSKLNVLTAARRFADGVAPFIIFSGANVHPRGTHYVEAVEMAHAAALRFGIPQDSILLDPYARHTTTNLRNATRLLSRLQAPQGRDVLVISNANHIKYIHSPDFITRNQSELGYQPAIVVSQTSDNELVMRPDRKSLRRDPLDPLDP
jgi:hypothetical protein